MPYIVSIDSTPAILSDFGDATSDAVVKLQKVLQVKADGIYGSDTDSTLYKFVSGKFGAASANLAKANGPIAVMPQLAAFGVTPADSAAIQKAWQAWSGRSSSGGSSSGGSGGGAITPTGSDYNLPTGTEDESFIDKYWWAIALAALSTGGVLIWKMKTKKDK